MDSMKTILNNVTQNFEYRAPFKNPAATEEMDKEVLNYIFKEIKIICVSHRYVWATQEDYINAKRSWYRAFNLVGLNNMALIERGLDKLRIRCGKEASFVPTSGQFIEMCKITPEEMGIPSLEEAYREAATQGRSTWSHPIVYYAWYNSGPFEMKTLPRSQNFPIFERNYQILLRKMLNGEELPEIPKAIEHKREEKPVEQTPERARAHLAALKALLNE